MADGFRDRADPGAAEAIPPRIRAAIASHEAQSEIIVGRIQLAGVALFAALYAASRPAFAVQSSFEPAPIALAAYGLFTALRLERAARGKLGPRLQYLSVVVDIGVFIALVWSFPFQYGAPFALYLKAPTLAYVFVLIALRALRFDPAQVWFAGALAALGWALLAFNALIDGAEITSSYPRYMTSLTLLPGAEFEKIAAIVAFTAVLALGVSRTRALLLRTAREEQAAKDLAHFVGKDAAARIRSARDEIMAGDGERRFAAVMMIDLSGFTKATADMPPEEVIGVLKDFQARIVPIVEGAGGSVDKFLGDGVLASFGAAQASDKECADALRAALLIGAAAQEWSQARLAAGLAPFAVRTAVTAGDVVYGAVGAPGRLEYTVIGEPVNLVAKLEKHAKREGAQIIASAAAIDRARAQGLAAPIVRRVASALVEGASAPVNLVIVATATPPYEDHA